MSLGILNVSAIRTATVGTYAAEQTDTKTAAGTDAKTAASTDSKAVAAPASGLLDRDAFLKLLVAQLKYQDPSKPMDASQMISQSAQLTMVDKLESMSSMMEASALTTKLGLAGSVIGKEITFTSDDGTTVKDVVTSVRFADDGTLILHTGDWDVPMDVIQSIGAPTAVPEATDPAATTTTTPTTTTPTTTTPTTTTPTTTTPTTATPTTTTPTTTTPTTTTPTTTTPTTTTPTTTTPTTTTPTTTTPTTPASGTPASGTPASSTSTTDPAATDPATSDPVATDGPPTTPVST